RESSDGVAFVVAAPRLIPQTQAVLASSDILRKALVLAPTQLREDTCYKSLAILGPVSWYPDHILGAPRAKEVHVLQYGWIQDPWKPKSVFLASVDGETERRERTHVVPSQEPGKPGASRSPDELISALEVLPQVNWERLAQEHSRRMPGEQGQEEVEA